MTLEPPARNFDGTDGEAYNVSVGNKSALGCGILVQ